MNFGQAISSCMAKFVTFSGRATRSEFWWFYLFCMILSWGAIIVGETAWGFGGGNVLSSLINLVLILPVISVGSRRLHDIGRTGWWQLISITGIGIILLIVWWATDSKTNSRYAY